MSTLAAVLEQLGGAWTWPFDSGTDAGPRGQIITAFAGAFAGAYGAQWISERNKRHTDVAKELRETNAAVALAATNCNVLINLKKQHVRDLKQRYDEEKAQFLAYFELTDAERAHVPPPVAELDLQTLRLPRLPLDEMRQTVFEKISATDRPLLLTSMILAEVEELNISLSQRYELK